MFSLNYSLLKMDAYYNAFQKIFMAKNQRDSKQIKSNHIAGSVNAQNHFHF